MDLDNAPKDDALGAMQRERDKARAERDALLPLARFGRWCLDEGRNDGGPGDIDGGSLQDAGEKLGVLAHVTVAEPCGEICECQEYYGADEWPVQCLRETDAAKVLDE